MMMDKKLKVKKRPKRGGAYAAKRSANNTRRKKTLMRVAGIPSKRT